MKPFFLAFGLFLFPTFVWGVDFSTQMTSSGDQYFAGEKFIFSEERAGDLFAVGKIFEVSAPVAADVVMGGQNILFSAPVGDDIRVAASRITFDASVGDSIIAAGQDIILRSNASTGGDFWGMGQEIQVLGKISGNAKISAQKLILDAEISGNAEIFAQEIVFEKNAKILGNAQIKTNSHISEENLARISGTTNVENFPKPFLVFGIFPPEVFFSFFVTLAMGALFLFFAPHYSQDFVARARKSPFSSFGIGILALFLIPLLALLSLFSFFGIPLAFLFLFVFGIFCILAKILSGLAFSALVFPSFFTESFARRFLFFFGGVFALFLLSAIPLVGVLLSFFFFLFAFGIALQSHFFLIQFLREKKKI